MTFRRRIVLFSAAAVAAAIALAAVVTCVVVGRELHGAVDASLRGSRSKVLFVKRVDAGRSVAGKPGQNVSAGSDETVRAQLPPTALGGSVGVVQARLPSGDVIRSSSGVSLPTNAAVGEVASGKRDESLRDETVDGVPMRVLTARGPGGSIVQVAKPSRMSRTRSDGCAGSSSR
jgi:hypothetical protein